MTICSLFSVTLCLCVESFILSFKFVLFDFSYGLVYMLIYSVKDFVFNDLMYSLSYSLIYFVKDLPTCIQISSTTDSIISSVLYTKISRLTNPKNKRLNTFLSKTLHHRGNTTPYSRAF